MQKRKTIIIFVILALVIGFASITTILNITGRTSVGFDSEKFASDVIFTSSVLDGTDVTETTIKENGKKIEFTSRELTMPGEKVVLDYVVTNNSKQYAGRATVRVVEFDEEYLTIENTPMTFDLSPESNEPGELIITLKKSVVDDTDVKIVVEIEVEPIYPEEVTTTTATTTTTTTTTTIDPEDEGKEKYPVEIDPAGGLYNGLPDVVTTEVVEGKTITLSKVTREGHLFRHWLVNDKILSGNKVTITEETHIVAVWADESEAVARINEELFISIQSAFDDAKTDDIIELLKSTEEVSTNDKKVTLDLCNFKVTGQIINEGNLTIVNGTIENEDGTAIINSGTLTIGNNSDEEVSITIPAIIGTDKGIENTGTFNFYDGYIEAKMWLGGNYNSIPIDYSVFVDHNDDKNCQKTYLVKDLNTAIAENRNPYIYYRNLQDAIRSSEESGKYIYARKDFETAYELSVSDEKSIYFDIVGHKIEFGYTVTNNGTLTITNSNEETGIIKPSVTITNNGTLNIKDIKITETTSATVITNNGILNIENSTITGLAGYAIDNVSGTEINLDENSYLYANSYALYNRSQNEVTITNGTIVGISNASKTTLILDGNIKVLASTSVYAVANSGKLFIKDGTYSNNSANNYVINSNATIEIYGGTIVQESESKYAVNSTGTLTMYGGVINSNNTGIDCGAYGVVTIRKGEIYSNGIGIATEKAAYIYDAKIISNNSYALHLWYGNIYIYGGVLTSNNSYAVNTYGGTVHIYGGNLYGTTALSATKGGYSYPTAYIYGGTLEGSNYGIIISECTLTIGDKEESVQANNPVIMGELYGLYYSYSNSNSISFYGGILKGKTGSFVGEINTIPSGYKIITDEIDGYTSSYLTSSVNFIENGEDYYNSLQIAIDKADSGDTLKIVSSTIINESISVPADKKIIIDLAGNEVKMANKITNNGELEITDSSDGKQGILISSASSYFASLITNGSNAILTVKDAKIQCFASSSYLISGGQVNLDNAHIYGNSYLINCPKSNVTNSTLETGKTAITGINIIINSSKFISNTKYEYVDSYLITGSNITISSSKIEDSIKKNSIQVSASLNMNDVEIISSGDYGIDLSSASNVLIKDSKISVGGNYAIRGYYATFTIDNSEIISNGNYGIYVYYSSTATIINNSKIISNKYGVFVTISSKIILGVDDNELKKDYPLVQGKEYGIYRENGYDVTINFYDGILKGTTDSINTLINNTPEGTTTFSTTEDIDGLTYKVKYLQEQAKIVSYNGKQYNSLNKAIEDVSEKGTLELLSDATINYEWTIPEGIDVTLDMKGHTLSTANSIINNGILNISGGTIEESGNGYTIKNYNELELNTVTVTAAYNGLYSYTGSVSLTSSSITTSGTYNVYIESGEFNTTNSTFTTTGQYNTYIVSGELNITNSNFNSPAGNSYCYGLVVVNGEVNFNSGSIIGYNSLQITNSVTFVQKDGKVIGTIPVHIGTNSTYDMYGGSIESGSINNYGIFTINGGTITSYITNNRTLNMNSGLINSTANGAIVQKSVMNINGGTIVSTKGYAINNTGTLNIGENKIENEDIEIVGETYGIYSTSGTIAFYDGVIKGKTDRVYGVFNKLPEDKMIVYDIEEIQDEEKGNITYNTCYLANKEKIVSLNDILYDSFEEALEKVQDNETILLINDAKIVENITNNKNITIDLNGHELYLMGANIINNSGTLLLTNSDEEKEAYFYKINSNKMIANTGDLTINNINFINKNNNTSVYTITNSGSLTINSSSINTIGSGIENSANGKLFISGSTIENSDSVFAYSVNTKGNLSIETSDLKGYYSVYNSDSSVVSISESTLSRLYSYQANSVDLNGNTYTISLQSATRNGYTINSTNEIIYSLSNVTNMVLINPTIESTVTNSGTLSITGGEMSSYITNSNNLYINDFEINNTSSAFSISGSGETILDNVTINSSSGIEIGSSGTVNIDNCNLSFTSSYGIKMIGRGIVNINSSNLTVDSPMDRNYGINADTGTINITDSTIKVNYNDTLNWGSPIAYGIYINNADVTMGTQGDGEVSQEKPYVEAIGNRGTGIGVKKVNGYFKFFDGKIVGSTDAKPDTTTLVEPKYKAVCDRDPDTSYEYCILQPE